MYAQFSICGKNELELSPQEFEDYIKCISFQTEIHPVDKNLQYNIKFTLKNILLNS